MGVFNPNNVKVGPGTLYAAPLGTAEPLSITGAWPSGWTALGFTDQGSEFDIAPATAALEVEEEFWPLRQVITAYSGKIMFVLAETTRQNFGLVLNAGIGSSLIASTQVPPTPMSDSTLYQQPPIAGTEVRVMLGWDSLIEGASSGTDPFGRLIIRQALQTGTVKRLARKGNNKSTYAAEFSLEKPYGLQPFGMLFEPNQAA